MARQASVALALALLIVCAFSKPTDDGDVSPAHYFPSDIRERVTAGLRMFCWDYCKASFDCGAFCYCSYGSCRSRDDDDDDDDDDK